MSPTFLGQISQLRDLSASAWSMAVDTAGPGYPGGSKKRQGEMQELADEGLQAYKDALKALREDNIPFAAEALARAYASEQDGGDAQHSTRALELLEKLAAE